MRQVLFSASILMGCANGELVIGPELVGCTDYQTNNPPEERLEVRISDLLAEVYRDGVIEYCDVTFQPEISTDDGVILVREFWTDTVDDSCSTCFNPTIHIKDPSPGEYDVEWYLGDETIAFETIQFEVD